MGKIVVSLLFLLVISGCGIINSIIPSKPKIVLKSSFDGKDIAIFDMSIELNSISKEYGSITSDLLTEALFLNTNFSLIDRSIIKEFLRNNANLYSDTLSIKEIQLIGKELDANYIILGRLHRITNTDFGYQDGTDLLSLHCRIISTKSGDVVGVITHQVNEYEGVAKCLNILINEIAEAITK